MAQHPEATWPGFSPGPGPASMIMSPEPSFGFGTTQDREGNMDSPLVFARTPVPALQETACPDSSKKFNSWMQRTSPYAGHNTPPTASMKSVCPAAEGGEENTPPAQDEDTGSIMFPSQDHFQAWLRATSSTSWTPRKSPGAATPPPAPAPSPACATPMSIMRDLTHSAATPADNSGSQQQQQDGVMQQRQQGGGSGIRSMGGKSLMRQVQDSADSGSEDDEGDFGEASTTVGMAELNAATHRAAVASRMAAAAAAAAAVAPDSTCGSHQQQQPSGRAVPRTPPRVPAPTPHAMQSPHLLLGAGIVQDSYRQQQHQDELLQAAADSLATPLSQLNLGRGRAAAADQPATPPMLVGPSSRSFGAAPMGHVSSPAEQLIGLMLSPAADSAAGTGSKARRHHHHHGQQQQEQHTPSRLSGVVGGGRLTGGAPLSPDLQVINLMMQPAQEDAAAKGNDDAHDGAATGGHQHQHHHGGSATAAADQADANAAAGPASAGSGSGSSSVSGDESVSDDEMDVCELAALCGQGLGPDTPLSAILGMMLTPAAAGLTHALGDLPTAAQQQADDLNPRVLFADGDE